MSQQTTEKFFEYDGFWLSKRADTDKLYVTWYDPRTGRTKRQSTRTADVEQAKHQLIEFAKTQERKRTPDYIPEPHEVLIWDAVTYYLEKHMTRENPSRKTTEYSLLVLDKFFEKFALRYVSDLDMDVMDEFPKFRNQLYRENQLRRLKSYSKYAGWSDAALEPKLKTISDSTVSRDLTVLLSVLNFARKRKRLKQVPYIPLGEQAPARERWLTRDEFNRLYAAANNQRLKDFMMLMIHTLQRPRFLFELKVQQIDLENRRIDFLPTGKKQTRKGRPSIRVAENIVPLLSRLIDESQSGYILEYYGKPITTDMRKGFKEAAVRAELYDPDNPESLPVTPYTLRHTGATWLAQRGIDLWQISSLLGHKDTRMVERVYAKHHPDFQAKATATLDSLVEVEIPHASYAPKSGNSRPRANFQIPFKPMSAVSLGVVGSTRFELATSTMSICLEPNDYSGLALNQSYFVTLDSLGFSDLTRQLRASFEDGGNDH